MASVESQLGGQAVFDWRAEGLVCRLQVPLVRKAAAPAELNGRDGALTVEAPLATSDGLVPTRNRRKPLSLPAGQAALPIRGPSLLFVAQRCHEA